jgi:hypothetical protein
LHAIGERKCQRRYRFLGKSFLAAEALNYAIALQLMALALRTLKDNNNGAVHTVAWAISGRLEKALRLLKKRGR